MELSDLSPHAFIQKYRIKTESGVPLDFRDHLFWFDIISDQSQKQVWYKAAQVGGSTVAIVKTFWMMNRYGLDAIYTLPTANDVKDFVGGKVNRIISVNPVFQKWVRDKDSVEQKRVGENVIYYRGTWTERAALMVSSDLNIYDEEDRSKQEVIQQYASRQQHSKYKFEWHFSNPSVEGNGVSRYWNLSDQKHWFIRCGHCKREQYLSWPESIDQERRAYVCKHCHEQLTREDRRVGRWVQKHKNREYSGYWISLLMAPWIEAGEIVDYFNTKSKEYFWNFVLGLPYVGAGNTVTRNTILQNVTQEVNNMERVVIGCDSGIKKHYVLGTRAGIFKYGVTESWDTIRSFLRQYPRSIAVIDAMPDITEPRRLREEFPGRVFLCHYARDRKTMQLVRWGKGEEEGNVIADRNRMIQKVIDEFAGCEIPLFGTIDDWANYYSHWETLYRLEETDALGTPIFNWETKDGKDHWCHATVYWRIGMDKVGNGGGEVFLGTPMSSIPTAPTTVDAARAPSTDQLRNKKSHDWRL